MRSQDYMMQIRISHGNGTNYNRTDMKKKNNIISDWLDRHGDPEIDKFVETQLNQNKMKTEVTKKEMKAENLVDDFVKQWREKNNTEDAVYAAYHYDAMIAFAEYYNEQLNQNKMEKQKSVVEFLKEKLEDGHLDISNRYWNELLIEAKEMFKEQIESFYKIGYLDGESKVRNFNESIYNETFKSE